MNDRVHKLINNPDHLIEDLIEGLVAANPQRLTVEGETGRAVVARNGPRDGKVGIVIGGGSGHEPAFAGYVGKGLADAAACGNVFASPSPSQILDAGLAANGGAGVLFVFANYTGDVMNFSMAAESMVAEGIETRSFVVTDDIASAPPENVEERRGIAGTFFVFKVAGATADLGLSMTEIEAALQRANAATRTMGVALSACAMPQTGKPNFHVPAGEMEIGMGIHGEPGIARIPAETADAVTDRLLSQIVEELALGKGDRVAVLVNGLGSTTLLELYILNSRVAETLRDLEVEVHNTWVGEYCTSLDMAGASISVIKLDADLQAWLDHPCDTTALRVGAAVADEPAAKRTARRRAGALAGADVDRASLKTDGDITPEIFRAMLTASAEAIFADRDRLSELDGVIGDGDHGITMEIGWKAVLAALEKTDATATISEMSSTAANAFLDAVGASAGPLYASGFSSAGTAVSDRLNLDAGSTVAWLSGLSAGIVKRGGAAPGDKTMVDAWLPAVETAKAKLAEGGSSVDCLTAAASAAQDGADATRDMLSQRGRSKKLGERSIGHVDPGAASAAVLIAAWRDAAAARV